MNVFPISRAGNASPTGPIGYTSGGMDGTVLDNLGGVATPLISSLALYKLIFSLIFAVFHENRFFERLQRHPEANPRLNCEEYFFCLHICIK